MKFKSSYLIAVFIAVAAFLWIGSSFLTADSDVPETKQGTQEETKQEKSLYEVRVKKMDVQSYHKHITLTGRTESNRKTQLRAEVSGRIGSVNDNEGQAVEKDTVLIAIEENDRDAILKEAEQRVKQKEIEYNASKELAKKGYNSEIRLATAKAELETARADVIKAQLDLEHLQIKAPYDGVFQERHVEIGDYVSVGDEVASFVDLNPIKIVGFITEKQVSQLGLGDKASVVLLDKKEMEATVSYISSVANEQSRTFKIELSAPNDDHSIPEGLTARLEIEGAEHQAYFISPSSLSLADDGTVGVKIIDDEDSVKFVPVTILEDTTDGMWIEGLPESITLITVGQDFVKSGERVKPTLSDSEGLL